MALSRQFEESGLNEGANCDLIFEKVWKGTKIYLYHGKSNVCCCRMNDLLTW